MLEVLNLHELNMTKDEFSTGFSTVSVDNF